MYRCCRTVAETNQDPASRKVQEQVSSGKEEVADFYWPTSGWNWLHENLYIRPLINTKLCQSVIEARMRPSADLIWCSWSLFGCGRTKKSRQVVCSRPWTSPAPVNWIQGSLSTDGLSSCLIQRRMLTISELEERSFDPVNFQRSGRFILITESAKAWCTNAQRSLNDLKYLRVSR